MTFPLKDWIEDHQGLPFDLGRSGMPIRMPSVAAALDRPAPANDEALRDELAAIHGVPPTRLFLTHGATEGNFLALSFLARRTPGPRGGPPRCAVRSPEYPPIAAIAQQAGFWLVPIDSEAEAVAGSRPNNPTGLAEFPAPTPPEHGARPPWVVDETFREFTDLPTLAGNGPQPVWVVGSFTKLYGADELRVGFVIPPPDAVEDFARYHGDVTDEIPPNSVGGARAILRDRVPILEEVRGRFRTNLAALDAGLHPAQPPVAPVYFDRPGTGGSTDSLADAALEAGVLVCPGRFFGDPSGVRLTMTRPTFPADLEAYLTVRSRWAGR